MTTVKNIFENLEKFTREDGQQEFLASLYPVNVNTKEMPLNKYAYNSFELQISFLRKIIKEIDDLCNHIKMDDTLLISVKNQKLIRTCFQIVTSLGISQCLIPGLGVKLSKRCLSAILLPSLDFSDAEKYELLTECTDFFTRTYQIPVLKKIIITLHLSDFLASLIQLSFAPLKKPGTYDKFTMTEELHAKLVKDRQKYIQVYEYLVVNCFQPTLMKELLVIQGVTDPLPPMFVKKIVSKELSRRLIAPGGLLSLIRCFMENHDIDTGFDWKKIEMICKIVTAKHGNGSELSYLNVICAQLTQILELNNKIYLTTAIACILSLNEKYPEVEPVQVLKREVFQSFDYSHLVSLSPLPGTIILTPQEIDHKVNMLNACLNICNVDFPYSLLSPNLYILFLLGMECTKNDTMVSKIKDILLKCLQNLDKEKVATTMKAILFGIKDFHLHQIAVEEYNAGLTLKCTSTNNRHKVESALPYFLQILKSSTESDFVLRVFKCSLQMVIELNEKRNNKNTTEYLLANDDEPALFDYIDEQYAIILQLLSEISTFPKVVAALKSSPKIVLNFIEYFILKTNSKINEECQTVALVLLNTILANSKKIDEVAVILKKLIPVLKSKSQKESSMIGILSKEALLLISSDNQMQSGSEFNKAITDAFDELLPVRAHGIIALTKLIEANDLETIAKKHYVFCLFQEQLKDSDSYIYLSAINGIASLGTHCTDDVLHVLCKEFLKMSNDQNLDTKDTQNKEAETKMKIGDIIVKVTKKLGEMAIVHKTILLNTMLCGCRDDDPLIRTSALSNLAEIALVLHYKIGSIIYEVLHCVWTILETDKAIECRRAAVLIIASLIKGLGKEVLIQLKENLLPIYRTLKKLYNDNDEDAVLRLHAQIALEELNDIVTQFMFPEVKMEKQIFVLDKPDEIFK